VLSTREPAKLRDGLSPLGITLISAGSHTEPGGYTGAGKEKTHLTVRGKIVETGALVSPKPPISGEGASEWATLLVGRASPRAESQNGGSSGASPHQTNATGQFEIADDRSPGEVAELIRKLGYEPVWKDWDAALMT
jgi:2-iminoacetate synthase